MSKCLRKKFEERNIWIDKTADHKKHDYVEKYILKVVNDHPRAKVSYHIRDEYFDVLKCSHCNSVRAVPRAGYASGRVSDLNDYIDFPMLIGHYLQTQYWVSIHDLLSIEISDLKVKDEIDKQI